MMWLARRFVIYLATAIFSGLAFLIWATIYAHAHMPDRPDLNNWFGKLKSHDGGLCCSFDEGVAVATDAWDSNGTVNDVNSGYRVFLDGKWLEIPKVAVVEVPNLYGQAVVWPLKYKDSTGHEETYGVRCFMPGSGT